MRKLILFLTTILSLNNNAQPIHIANLGGSIPNNLFVFNNKLYFTSSQGNNGNSEMWVYDNSIPISALNPKMLIDLDSSATGSFPSFYTEYNGKLFFKNNNAVYSYVDTLPLSSTNPRYICPRAGGLTVYGGKLYFDIVPVASRTIWEFDDNLQVSSTNPKILVNQTLNPIKTSNYFIPFIFQNKMFFSATNNSTTGEELWVYDSSSIVSATNPSLLANINASTTANPANNGSIPSNFILYKNKLYFSANDGTGSELWSYDGTLNPQKVFDIDPNPYGGLATFKTIYNDTMYFAGHNNLNGTELWWYDGNNNPTLVKDINTGSNFSIPSNLKTFGNRLIFNADNGTNGRELWCFNSLLPVSNTNPFMIFDLNSGISNGISMNTTDNRYVQYGNLLYFGGSGGGSIGGLWALSLCTIGAASVPVFSLGNDITINVGDTISLNGPSQMYSYNWSNNSTNNQTSFIGTTLNTGSNSLILNVVDSNGCSYSDTILVNVTIANSVQSIKAEQPTFSIIPNPSNGKVNIDSSNEIEEITIVNNLGQTVFKDNPNLKNIQLQLNLNGIYFITISSKQMTTTRKVIINN